MMQISHASELRLAIESLEYISSQLPAQVELGTNETLEETLTIHKSYSFEFIGLI